MNNLSNYRYGAVSRALHWLTAVVVVVAFIYGPGGPEHRVYAPERDFERGLHETLGAAVFVLVLLRIMWFRIAGRPPAVPLPRTMHIAARRCRACCTC